MEQDGMNQTTAAKCDLYVGKTPVTAVIDSGAATSIITRPLLKELGYQISGPSNMVIVTANGSRVRALGTVNALPINLRHMIIPTDIHVLESQDKVLILGNDWLREVDAKMDWKNEELTLRAKGRTIRVPIRFTLERAYIAAEVNESDDEFEDEELEEAYVYFSDHHSVSSECSYESSEEDLEFNLWVNVYSPEHTEESENETDTEEDNPAVYLAQQVENVEQNSLTLRLGPLNENQQANFHRLQEDYQDICVKSQTKIGRTHLVKHKIITGNTRPIAQAA